MCVVVNADLRAQIWSWGIGDNGVLGRVVNDPSKGTTEELETTPHPITVLTDENFRAVRVAAGDSISLAISDQGELRAWGSFRVSAIRAVVTGVLTVPASRTKVCSASTARLVLRKFSSCQSVCLRSRITPSCKLYAALTTCLL